MNQDFFPTNKSAIFVEDFDTIEELVNLLTYLDKSDTAYEEYLSFKTVGGVTNQYLRQTVADRDWDIGDHWQTAKPNFIDGFQCYLCKQLHQRQKQIAEGQKLETKMATIDHYGCPEPRRFSDSPAGNLTRVRDSWWSSAWLTGKYMAMALRHFIENNITDMTEELFMNKTIELHNIYEIEKVRQPNT